MSCIKQLRKAMKAHLPFYSFEIANNTSKDISGDTIWTGYLRSVSYRDVLHGCSVLYLKINKYVHYLQKTKNQMVPYI